MRTPLILLSLLVLSMAGCSTERNDVRSRSDLAPPAQQAPVGTFVGPADGPLIKIRLESDGTYLAEDVGHPEFWAMAEGNTIYPQHLKFRPEKGRWALDTRTGQLTLKPETAPLIRWDTKHFRYNKAAPDRLAWGDYAFLERAVQ